MKITFLGHACFEIESANGTKLLIDPYESGAFGGQIRYRKIDRKVDIVLVTHEHADHNWTEGLPGSPEIFKMKGGVSKGINIEAIPSYHDTSKGSERGRNTIFKFSVDGINIAHLGDLGHILEKEQIEKLKDLDILFLPVGGVFTVDPVDATKVMNQLSPRVTIPMHFKTEKVGFPLKDVEEFIKGKEKVKRIDGGVWEVTKDSLPEPGTIVVLTPTY